jgi:ATP phosphoribosyltransferase regulatory subunit
MTPVFERAAVVAQGATPGQRQQSFQFFSPEGEVLALRSDLTTPIARLVAQRLGGERRPLRLAYVADVFRWAEPGGGRQRQFAQAGVELVGVAGPAADAEVVLVAVRALEEAGAIDFRIDLGQVSFFSALLAESGLGPEEQAEVREAFLAKDWVGLEATLTRACPDPERRQAILALTELRGGREALGRGREIAARVGNGPARRALDDLETVLDLLEDFGVAERIRIDLGLVKDLSYYTGMVLEGYVPRLGYTLCTGGRYDGLYAQFGRAEAATGFALGLERVTEALARQALAAAEPSPRQVLVVAAPGRRAEGLRLAERLGVMGVDVAWEVCGRSAEAAAAGGEPVLELLSGGGVQLRCGAGEVYPLPETGGPQALAEAIRKELER